MPFEEEDAPAATSGLEVALSPDGKQLATGSWDETARPRDATTGELAQALGGHSVMMSLAAFSADGSTWPRGALTRPRLQVVEEPWSWRGTPTG